MKNRTRTFLFLFFLAAGYMALGKGNPEKDGQAQSTNNIVLGKASLWIMGQAVQVGYERTLFEGKYGSFAASAAYGLWKDLYEDGDFFNLAGKYLLGKKSHHLELSVGAAMKIHYDQYYTGQNKFDHLSWLPDVSIGYRYKKPSGHLMLGAGVGFPSLVSVTMGYAF
ncbi:MAG TPA: hypothetical protein PLK12_03055 [Prolixibacteraceae bacterium]|nr:hypothetical protein [Prolixibacteraceae bacterium]